MGTAVCDLERGAQFSLSAHVTSVAIALSREPHQRAESSHQANMQIIIGLKWKRGKMFRDGGKAPRARPSTEAARALGPAACMPRVCSAPQEKRARPQARPRRLVIVFARESARERSAAGAVPQVSDI